MQEEYVLNMEHISKIYGNGIVANEDVNFNLKRGEIHALVGENGAGKTSSGWRSPPPAPSPWRELLWR